VISEFTVAGSHQYDRSGPVRWILSHIWRNKRYAVAAVTGLFLANILNSLVMRMVGWAFDNLLETPPDRDALRTITLVLIGVVILRSALDLSGWLMAEVTAQRLERDVREELYLSLLGKSQTFHNRQRVGDLMARANNDVRQMNMMIVPGSSLIIDAFGGLIIPIVFIGLLKWQLLLAPLVFTVCFLVALRRYMRKLDPVAARQRTEFGHMNSVLTEAVSGIEVVKSTVQEEQEQKKFLSAARSFREAAVRQGRIEAGYLPTLFLGLAIAGAAVHGLILVERGQLTIGQLVAFLGLMQLLRFPTFISLFSFSLISLGRVSGGRILGLIKEETRLDENQSGYAERIEGQIRFENVCFDYEGDPPSSARPVPARAR
jgi:ATP-binding cassette subfamily B protein